jgi:hypothetical protein
MLVVSSRPEAEGAVGRFQPAAQEQIVLAGANGSRNRAFGVQWVTDPRVVTYAFAVPGSERGFSLIVPNSPPIDLNPILYVLYLLP